MVYIVRSVLDEVSGIVDDVPVDIIFHVDSVGTEFLDQTEDGAAPPSTDQFSVARFVELTKMLEKEGRGLRERGNALSDVASEKLLSDLHAKAVDLDIFLLRSNK